MSCNDFVFHGAIGCEMSSCEGQDLLHPKQTWASGSEATTKNGLWSVVQAANSWSKSEQERSWASWCCWQKHPPVSIKRVYLIFSTWLLVLMCTQTPSCLSVGWVSIRDPAECSARHSQAFGNESLGDIESSSLETLTQRMKSPLHVTPSEKGLTLQISQLWAQMGPTFPLQLEICAQDVDKSQMAKPSWEDFPTMLINIVLNLRKDYFASNLNM